MTEESASSAEKQGEGEVPPWAPPGWEVPAPDASVPPYAAPPGWQPPPPHNPPHRPDSPPQPPYAAPLDWQPQGGGQRGWHGAGPGTVANAPVSSTAGHPPPQSNYSVGGYEQPYGYQPHGGYPQPRDTNGFAIASLVSALVGIIAIVIGPLLGVIFGVIALRQLDRSPARGRGLAIAGIAVGAVLLLLDILGLIGLATGHGSSNGGGFTTLYPAVALRSLA